MPPFITNSLPSARLHQQRPLGLPDSSRPPPGQTSALPQPFRHCKWAHWQPAIIAQPCSTHNFTHCIQETRGQPLIFSSMGGGAGMVMAAGNPPTRKLCTNWRGQREGWVWTAVWVGTQTRAALTLPKTGPAPRHCLSAPAPISSLHFGNRRVSPFMASGASDPSPLFPT